MSLAVFFLCIIFFGERETSATALYSFLQRVELNPQQKFAAHLWAIPNPTSTAKSSPLSLGANDFVADPNVPCGYASALDSSQGIFYVLTRSTIYIESYLHLNGFDVTTGKLVVDIALDLFPLDSETENDDDDWTPPEGPYTLSVDETTGLVYVVGLVQKTDFLLYSIDVKTSEMRLLATIAQTFSDDLYEVEYSQVLHQNEDDTRNNNRNSSSSILFIGISHFSWKTGSQFYISKVDLGTRKIIADKIPFSFSLSGLQQQLTQANNNNNLLIGWTKSSSTSDSSSSLPPQLVEVTPDIVSSHIIANLTGFVTMNTWENAQYQMRIAKDTGMVFGVLKQGNMAKNPGVASLVGYDLKEGRVASIAECEYPDIGVGLKGLPTCPIYLEAM